MKHSTVRTSSKNKYFLKICCTQPSTHILVEKLVLYEDLLSRTLRASSACTWAFSSLRAARPADVNYPQWVTWPKNNAILLFISFILFTFFSLRRCGVYSEHTYEGELKSNKTDAGFLDLFSSHLNIQLLPLPFVLPILQPFEHISEYLMHE